MNLSYVSFAFAFLSMLHRCHNFKTRQEPNDKLRLGESSPWIRVSSRIER